MCKNNDFDILRNLEIQTFRECRNYIMALRACKIVASRLCYFLFVFAPAAPWDRVRGKNGIEIGVEMAEIFNENRSK